VRLKLNAIREEVVGKNVLLVDDSIVRGTTSKEIIEMVREAGAAKVYFASAAPKVCFPNVYGIDIPTSDELIAYNKSEDEIAELIGADWLIYQDLEQACQAINDAALTPDAIKDRFEDAIFTGDYVAGSITPDYLSQWGEQRRKKDKNTAQSEEDQRLLQDFMQG
jgi:amidophosphoribosyltransferase